MGFARLGSVDWKRAALGLLITITANLVAHYADEYADVDTDSLTQRTPFSGGSGVLPEGLVPPSWALRTALGFGVLTVFLALGAVIAGWLSPHILWIVGLGMLGGWFYCMPPLALERRGVGELDNALIGGILMPLMGYTVQVQQPDVPAALALIPIFLIVMVG